MPVAPNTTRVFLSDMFSDLGDLFGCRIDFRDTIDLVKFGV